jgi:mono/diheme cytochrome c family protein
MRTLLPAALLPILILFLSAFQEIKPLRVSEETPLNEVLVALGDSPLPHQVDLSIPGVSAEAGRKLVHEGKAMNPKGGTTALQSRHFVCTSCHNIQREDPNLSVSDPQARLEYVAERGMPFLQGTALYGAVNRTGFYNGDYENKYGELVEPARNDIREAIQLCAIECAQGRPLDDWEVESILAYLWEIELTLGDLILSEEEYRQISSALEAGGPDKSTVELLHSKYLSASPATFVTPPEDRRKGYGSVATGNPENGALIYELSCLHCHEGQRYAFFQLSDTKDSFRYLRKHFPKYTRYSCYQVVRYGTSPLPGKRAYMPNYTQEKMSDQQLEDLRAYIEQEAKR